MIVDSSAVVAVLQGEAQAAECAERMVDEECRMSAANWLEAAIVVDNRSVRTQRDFEELIEGAQAKIARDAYRRYGRGSGHKASLNYGDCFAYALAVTTGEPLLFVGDDFAATDVVPALRDDNE